MNAEEAGFHLAIAADAMANVEMLLRSRKQSPCAAGRLLDLFGAVTWLKTARRNVELAEQHLQLPAAKGGRT